ncbi:UDP-4-amino-4,6-dideoxy-N-acetyl-beta-L-altrosamine N-acetyltransferase [Agarivorans sp. TSD2052]|uniref:UDP-4-amino-4, 6-dideoxy-N-acetyl-beta-L-altrosamine N-acetyltransferase n=1 Tax=Agarivorans sp. TSD2052 TaxID=2937286 RepID=UPI002010386B|nr:UDP-4-amino-4,6-dideoxy-N-acetyl-beta-L-altrosamine N-acetyltransferase [Agarivorans sp. TSD2052]UPW20165.1 UDP-4-amino-4,6-dideoxy-N-acetyl-beta-L-altrosamine N-acetyltransferase [Agarivorans sp. TSD2052]
MSKHYPQTTFSLLESSQLELVLGWRNQDRVRNMMRNSELISFENHQAWFAGLSEQENCDYFIFYQDGRPIGVLNFDIVEPGILEWGCYLGETDVWPGSGLLLEIAALDYSANYIKHSIDQLKAEVLSTNPSVLKLRDLFEYQLKASSNIDGVKSGSKPLLHDYRYPVLRWQQQRERVLAKLPKQITEAAKNIRFIL